MATRLNALLSTLLFTSRFGIIAGVLMIMGGMHLLLRPDSAAGWLESQGVPHTPERSVFLRQIKMMGVGFILGGGLSIYVGIINP